MINQILNFINPQPPIGGLEISESDLRFVGFKRGNVFRFGLKLAPGIIEDGKIKNRQDFLTALLKLRAEIAGKTAKRIYIVVNISDSDIYTEIFNLPFTASANINEAANLNLQMISPIDINFSYYDWQLLGEKVIEGSDQLEFFGAFIPKHVINEYESVLTEAGFGVAAVEFPGLSLTRILIEAGEEILKDKAYFLLYLGGNGLTFCLIKNGNLYFAHSVSWSSVYGSERKIVFDSFKKLIIDETKKVLNFYENHWQGNAIENFLIVAPGLINEISRIVSENFPSLTVKIPVLKKFKELTTEWFAALGGAVRGLIPRSEDTIISLASIGTEEKFRQFQTLNFIKIWRNIVFASLFFVFLIFASAEWFLIKTEKALEKNTVNASVVAEKEEIGRLENEAINFNKKIESVLAAKKQSAEFSPFFEKIRELAAEEVTIDRILVQSAETPVIISGRAKGEKAVIDFKDVLEKTPQFKNINLPFSTITPAGNQMFNFSISFTVTSFKF
ncbi:hypothetical protein HZB06_02500 [Candidatus Wolfebacteria bacterium]|nr:hypothetical protein [Candidatus Wolfebacteria bacterium]